jgi:hypothetical protein
MFQRNKFKINHFVFLIILIILSLNSNALKLGNNQNGERFKTYKKSSFPLNNFNLQLNRLQVLDNVYSGGLLKSQVNNFSINNITDDYSKLLSVFPDIKSAASNIYEIDKLLVKSGRSQIAGWSYHAFPIYKGGLAYRFNDPIFVKNEDWNILYNEYVNNPTDKLISNKVIDQLSPIEKYEYLIGNTNFNLTKSQWNLGKIYADQNVDIPTWMGICHGTAPAIIQNSRPLYSIKLLSYDQQNMITFSPADLKALLAYAWAMNATPTEIMGRKCNRVIQPEVRPEQNCLDTNPGAFFLATVNLMGLNQKAFIIDAAASIETWNRTVINYVFTYFRPGTRNLTDKLNLALINRDQYKLDPFYIYRSPLSKFLVGIKMDVQYNIGTIPTNISYDSNLFDKTENSTYWFDLELDPTGKIIGGEWYNNNHPDFVWVISPKLLPKSTYDYAIDSSLNYYDGKKPLSKIIVDYAKLASLDNTILYSIVEAMLKISQTK